MRKAKVFKNRRSQAIRLPKEFRVATDEVYQKGPEEFMGNDNSWLGKASVWSCITGVVLPGRLLALVLFNERLFPLEIALGAIGPCYILFVILELVALGCGIAATW